MDAFLRYTRHIIAATAVLGATVVVGLFLLYPVPGSEAVAAASASVAPPPAWWHPVALSVAAGVAVGLFNFRFVDVRAIELCAQFPAKAFTLQWQKLVKTLVLFGLVLYPSFRYPAWLWTIPLLLGLLSPRMVLYLDSVLRPTALQTPLAAVESEASAAASLSPDGDGDGAKRVDVSSAPSRPTSPTPPDAP